MKLMFLALLLPLFSYAEELSLIGKGLLEYSVFKVDIYEISYHKGKDNLAELRLNYKIDVKEKYSVKGWEKGLESVLKQDPTLSSKVSWIYKNTVDFVKGDELTIRKNNAEVTLLKNGSVFAHTIDEQIAKIIFLPWIGPDPVDNELKKQLLKNEEKSP